MILSISLNFGQCLIKLYQTLSSHCNRLKAHSRSLMIWKRWVSEINSHRHKSPTRQQSSTPSNFSKSNNTKAINMPTTSNNTSAPNSKTTLSFNKINNSNHTMNNRIINRTTITKINNSCRITRAHMTSSMISLIINNNNDNSHFNQQNHSQKYRPSCRNKNDNFPRFSILFSVNLVHIVNCFLCFWRGALINRLQLEFNLTFNLQYLLLGSYLYFVRCFSLLEQYFHLIEVLPQTFNLHLQTFTLLKTCLDLQR